MAVSWFLSWVYHGFYHGFAFVVFHLEIVKVSARVVCLVGDGRGKLAVVELISTSDVAITAWDVVKRGCRYIRMSLNTDVTASLIQFRFFVMSLNCSKPSIRNTSTYNLD